MLYSIYSSPLGDVSGRRGQNSLLLARKLKKSRPAQHHEKHVVQKSRLVDTVEGIPSSAGKYYSYLPALPDSTTGTTGMSKITTKIER